MAIFDLNRVMIDFALGGAKDILHENQELGRANHNIFSGGQYRDILILGSCRGKSYAQKMMCYVLIGCTVLPPGGAKHGDFHQYENHGFSLFDDI
jgi:hypothetical protein